MGVATGLRLIHHKDSLCLRCKKGHSPLARLNCPFWGDWGGVDFPNLDAIKEGTITVKIDECDWFEPKEGA